MAGYQVGNWTKSTVEALKFISDENKAGRRPKLKHMKSGTYKNWAWVLKQGGYAIDENGYFLNEKGQELLNNLLKDPPKDRRGKIKKRASLYDYNKEESQKETKSKTERKQDNKVKKGYRVSVEGRDTSFGVLVTHDEAMRIIKEISQIKGNN